MVASMGPSGPSVAALHNYPNNSAESVDERRTDTKQYYSRGTPKHLSVCLSKMKAHLETKGLLHVVTEPKPSDITFADWYP